MKKIIRFGAVAAALGLVMVGYQYRDDQQPSERSSSVNRPAPSVVAYEADVGMRRDDSAFVSGLERLPGSLRGTEPDGVLQWDEHGNLIITSGVRDRFDYFLAAIGEESEEQLIRRLKAHLRFQLPEPAASQAIGLLEDYLAMRHALARIDGAATDHDWRKVSVSGLRERLDRMQALRNQFLSPDVVQAFYGEEDAYDRYTLERLEIMENETLGPDERASLLANLDASLPQDLRTSLESSQTLLTLSALSNELQQQGADQDELYALRTSLVGSEAAERLRQLDDSRKRWQARLDAWLMERDNLLREESMEREDKLDQLAVRRREFFQQSEISRVEALEYLHDQQSL